MRASQDPHHHIFNVLTNIFKRSKAFSFRMIFLGPQLEPEQTTRIRHYDNECEGAELIAHILKTSLEKQKLQSFLIIKSYSKRRFRRTSTPRAKSKIERTYMESKESDKSTNALWHRPSSSSKSYVSSKKDQLSDIFSRVKMLAGSLTESDSTKKLLGKQDQNSKRASSQIFTKIEQLQANMQYLFERNSATKEPKTTSSIRKTRERDRHKNIKVQKFQIYI